MALDPGLVRPLLDGGPCVFLSTKTPHQPWLDAAARALLGEGAGLDAVFFAATRHTGAEPLRVPLEWQRPRAGSRRVELTGWPARDAGGELVGVLGTLGLAAHPLRFAHAAQARVDAELRDAHATLERAQRVARIGSWSFDVASGHAEWSAEMFRIVGLPPAHVAPTSEVQRERFTPESWERLGTAVARALATGEGYALQLEVVRPDGERRHAWARCDVERDVAGHVAALVGTFHDVTEQVLAERERQRDAGMLAQFVRHAPAPIAMLDLELRYLHTSEAWQRTSQVSGAELVGRRHYDVFPDLPERWKQAHRRVLAGAVESCAEDEFKTADGSTVWVQWEARPWHRPDGSVGGLMLFTLDITERKALELQLRRRKLELRRSNEDLDRFATVASHDLQEPLRAIVGCAELLAREVGPSLSPKTSKLVHHIVDGATRMRRMVTDLLAYSRVGSTASVPGPVQLASAAAQALQNLESAVAESKAVVDVGPLPTVVGDASQLTQVLQNLVGNALKYRSTSPPHVAVRAARVDAEWRISVSDDGIGIDPMYFERIFQLFQRLHTQSEYPGTGLGLSLCQRIVQRHGGRIWVESRPGHGSTFHFTLPA